MSEQITAFRPDKPDEVFPYDRDKFYQEQVEHFRAGKKPNMGCHTIEMLIFNEAGEMLVQKRSYTKHHNPGLLDKSVGGHIQFGDGLNYTAMIETVQEIQVPSIIVDDEDYPRTFDLMKRYLGTIAVMKNLGVFIHDFPKIIGDDTLPVLNKKFVYLGVYAGATKTVDGESAGILQYPLDQLKAEVEQHPETFTHDLRMILEVYGQDLEDFVAFLQKN